MLKEDPNDKLKSQLSEAVLSICKSWAADGKVNLTIEGLLAITIKKEVVLVNMKEKIATEGDEGRDFREGRAFSGGQFPTELNGQDDIMHNLSYAFGPFLGRDDCDKGTFEEMLAMEVGDSSKGSTDEKMKGDLEEDNLLKGSLDYSTLSLPDVSSGGMDRFGEQFDDNPSNLFDFDDIINKPAKVSSASLVLQQNLLLGDLERSTGNDNVEQFGNDILMVSDLNWGSTSDRAGDVGPLNLAGPQDLSLGLDKRKFFCGVCGSVYTSEQGHVCKSARLNTAVTSEPLNLKSQPLDLTTGPIYLAMDGSLSHQPVLSGAPSVTYDLLTKHTLNSSKDKAEAFKKCEMCGKYLFSNSGYLKHKKQHAGKFRYSCDVCHKGFFDQTNLKTHVDSSHSKLKRYECNRCSKSFFWKHHLKRHAETCKGAAPVPSGADGDVATASGSTAQSLPVISNFLLSIGNRSATSVAASGKENPQSCSAQALSCSLKVTTRSSLSSPPKTGTTGACHLGALRLLAAPNDFAKYLRTLPDLASGVAPVISNGNNPPITFLSLQPQTAIVQLQNLAHLRMAGVNSSSEAPPPDAVRSSASSQGGLLPGSSSLSVVNVLTSSVLSASMASSETL